MLEHIAWMFYISYWLIILLVVLAVIPRVKFVSTDVLCSGGEPWRRLVEQGQSVASHGAGSWSEDDLANAG